MTRSKHQYECLVKQTEKAVLVKMDGVERWIPKSACELCTDGLIWIAEWFAKNMDDQGAIFSDDKTQRFVLWRNWNKNKRALVIGLNPSRATTVKNDPTIERLCQTLSNMGYGGFRMVNLFTVISSDPKILLDEATQGDEKVAMGIIFGHSLNCEDVIFGWGAFEEAKVRATRVVEFFTKGMCFGTNKDGSPWHPQTLMYAGFSPKKVSGKKPQLFLYSEHTYEKNIYNRKDHKAKMEHSEKQYTLIP